MFAPARAPAHNGPFERPFERPPPVMPMPPAPEWVPPRIANPRPPRSHPQVNYSKIVERFVTNDNIFYSIYSLQKLLVPKQRLVVQNQLGKED